MLSDPQDVDTWRNMGNCLAAQHKFDEAASAYETALGLAVGDRTIAFLRASAHAGSSIKRIAGRRLASQLVAVDFTPKSSVGRSAHSGRPTELRPSFHKQTVGAHGLGQNTFNTGTRVRRGLSVSYATSTVRNKLPVLLV